MTAQSVDSYTPTTDVERIDALDVARGFALHGHCTDKNAIRPCQVLFRQLGYIEVDQSLGPVLGQHSCYRQQAQWWYCGALANKLQGVLKTPEGIWKFRVNQQNIHGAFPPAPLCIALETRLMA